MSSQPVIELRDVHASYGIVPAIRGVDLAVMEGETVALLGANGAGKSTVLRSISGLLAPTSGSILLAGKEITGQRAHRIAAAGITLVPEGRRIFPNLTVEENLVVGAYLESDLQVIARRRSRMVELFPILADRRHQLGSTLSGGEQQMLAIARGLMADPRVLLLDEPSLGLAPLMVREVFAALHQLRELGVTVLLVEQNAAEALAVSDRAYVLQTGTVVQSGPSQILARQAAIRSAYLGGVSALEFAPGSSGVDGEVYSRKGRAHGR